MDDERGRRCRAPASSDAGSITSRAAGRGVGGAGRRRHRRRGRGLRVVDAVVVDGGGAGRRGRWSPSRSPSRPRSRVVPLSVTPASQPRVPVAARPSDRRPDRHPAQAEVCPGSRLGAPVVVGAHGSILPSTSFRDRDDRRPSPPLDPPNGQGHRWWPLTIRAARDSAAGSLRTDTERPMTDTSLTPGPGGPGRHARRQPVRRAPQQGRLRRGQGLPAARRHRPRRVLGRQRPPGVGLLPGAVGLHAGRLLGPRDRRPRPGELRHAPARHPDRADGAADPRRRDRRARPRARRRRPGHRVRGRGLGGVVARDDDPRRPVGDGAGRARRRRGRRPAPQRGLDVRRGPPQLRRPARLPRRVRARAIGRSRSRRRRRPASACSRSTTASATSGSAT